MRIDLNTALFSLIRFTYGGDGIVFFALPNLAGSTPIHASDSHPVSDIGGSEFMAFGSGSLPAHTHTVNVSSAATGGDPNPGNRFLGGGVGVYHAPNGPLGALPASSLASAGISSNPHENRQPYLVLKFYIALTGIFPSS